MVGDFNGCNPKLYTEKLAGGVKACLGFVKTHRAEYVPNTVLNTDIRTVTKISQQVIATYRRKNSASPYQELVYKAKKLTGIPLPFRKNMTISPSQEKMVHNVIFFSNYPSSLF